MSVNQRLVNPLMTQLFEAILLLKTKEECYEFFEDLCTVNELRDMSQRLEVAKMLNKKEKYETKIYILWTHFRFAVRTFFLLTELRSDRY